MIDLDIKEAAENGSICKMFNHRWVETSYKASMVHFVEHSDGNLEQIKPIGKRKCDICGAMQVKLPERWEEHKSNV